MDMLTQQEINELSEMLSNQKSHEEIQISFNHSKTQIMRTTSDKMDFIKLREGEFLLILDTDKLYIGGLNNKKICLN